LPFIFKKDSQTKIFKEGTLHIKSSSAIVSLGETFYFERQYDKAVELFRKALRKDPKKFQAFNGLGIALYAQGKYTEASQAFEHALLLKPKCQVIYLNLGITLCRSGEYLRAVQPFKRYLEAGGEELDRIKSYLPTQYHMYLST
jgi:Flp pilus assembly protein TadD